MIVFIILLIAVCYGLYRFFRWMGSGSGTIRTGTIIDRYLRR